MRLLGSVLAVLLGLVACSPELARIEPGPGALVRLSLEAADSLPERMGTQRVERLEAPEAFGAWRAEAEHGEPRIEEVGELGAVRVVTLPGEGHRRVGIRGPFDPTSFNALEIGVLASGPERLQVQLMRRGRPFAGTGWVRFEPEANLRQILVDLPGLRLERQPFDELVVSLQSRDRSDEERSVSVASVDLLYLPWHERLPGPGGPGELVALGGRSRRGYGLSSEHALRASADLGDLGAGDAGGRARLTFAYGQPRVLAIEGQRPTLVVEVRADGERVERSFPVGEPGTWRTAELELEGSGTAEVRFELRSSDANEALCAVAEPELCVLGRDAPTVLLVTSDTHRGDHLGAISPGLVATPVLDALAARGVLFEDCFTQTNITTPSHVALMTAVHPRDTGVWNNSTRLAEEADTLAERFRDAGFATVAVVSAAHLEDLRSGLGQGFDRMSAPEQPERRAEVSIADLERWMDELDGRPLFVWLHLFDAHSPYSPPVPFDGRYYPEGRDPYDPSIPLGVDEHILPSWTRACRDPEHLRALREAGLPAYACQNESHLRPLHDVEFPYAQYRGEVDYLDRELARVLDRPRVRNGAVAVTADHGESFGQHDVWWNHGDLYPDTIRVPLILAWPGAPGGTRVRAPVRQFDVGRTLLDLAGLRSTPFPGRSLITLVEDPDSPTDPRFALSFARNSASVTVDGWHLILHLRQHVLDHYGVFVPREMHQTLLYHLPDDPECEHDLVDVEHERAKRMRELLVDWLSESHVAWSNHTISDPEHIHELANLGYADDGGEQDSGPLFDRDCACEWCKRFR